MGEIVCQIKFRFVIAGCNRLNICRKNLRDNLKNDIHVRKYLVHNLLLTFCVFISINLLIRNNKKNMPALYTKSYLDYAKLQ